MAAVKDRLAELQAGQKGAKTVDKDKMKTKKKSKVADDMEGLQEQVRNIEGNLTTINRNVKEMEDLQKRILSSPFCDKADVYKYDQIVNHVQQVSSEARQKLRVLEQETGSDGSTALQRVGTHQLNRLTNTLAAYTNAFFKIQADYMDKMKKRMRSQLEVTKGTNNISDDEVNEILQKDNYNAFTQNFISDTQDAASQLRQIEDRQKDILALEKNVFDVNQLFKDMSVLIHDQGEKLDNIESNMTQTATHVEEGNTKLRQAKRHRKRSRRCMLIVAGIVIVIIVVVIIAVAATFA
ncbi:syntaxin-1A-like [Haliotis cracherodii]|uniref:syntaxin-1A-like n=1 Tax=Haliotis cracherodii TaxID=6455 RepID=UPI0039E95C3A